MDSTNNIDADDGNSTTSQEGLPTTTSVLDKSRSLFGNPSAVLSTTNRDPTPDVKESTTVTNSSVSMETDEKEGLVGDDAEEEKERSTSDMASTKKTDTTKSSPRGQSHSPKQADEAFEKKIVSMDTSGADSVDKSLGEANEDSTDKADEDSESKSDNDLVVDDDENNEDEEEEEVPKKKAKRTVADSEEDDEDKSESHDSAEADDSDSQSHVNNRGTESLISNTTPECDSPAPSPEAAALSGANGDEQSTSVASRDDDMTEQVKKDGPTEKVTTEDASESVENTVKDTVGEDDDADSAKDNDESTNSDTEIGNDNVEAADNDDEDNTVEIEADKTNKEVTDSSMGIDNKKDEDEQGVDEAAEDGDEVPNEEMEVAGEENEGADGNDTNTQQVQEPNSSTRSTRARKTPSVVSTPSSSTPKRGTRGRKSVTAPQEDDTAEDTVATPKRGRSSRKVQDEIGSDQQDVLDAHTEEPQPEAASSGRGRSRRSIVNTSAADETTGETDASVEPTTETPKRGTRSRRSAASSTPVTTTPRSARGKPRKSQVSEEVDEEPIDPVEEGDHDDELEEEVTVVPKKAGRTPRVKNSTAKEESANEDNGIVHDGAEAPTSSRRSTRTKTAPASAKATPVVDNKRTPARGKKQVSISEEVADSSSQASSAKKGRGSTKSTPSSSNKNDEYDPYDLNTEMEHHPEPLKNIQFEMEVQNFGAVKFGKAGQSESKYSMTERAAEARIADLQTSPTSKNKRSLADMTPGKEKTAKRVSTGTGRRTKAKKEEPHENDVEMEEVSRPDSSETPVTSGRGRKRKSEGSELTPLSSKRESQISLKPLSSEEQLQADHPPNDDGPHAVGARVYANFQKTFYPAVILCQQDGLGRFKLQFTNDGVLKDVPNSGIIPLRDLAPGKTAIYNENDVLLDSGPDDISAEEWAKGIVTITILDDEGERTGDTKQVDWKDLSFDQAEWRDYIKTKEQNAASVVTSNITAIGSSSRLRKPISVPQQTKPVVRRQKGVKAEPSGGISDTLEEDDEDKTLPMREDAIGKDIFAGKIFMLTSANRNNASNVPPMFKKKNLSDFITENGGTVTEQHNVFHEAHPDRAALLISDTYYRTHKYLAALARGIPCIKNVWLQACGEQGKCVDYKEFILPAGASIFDDSEEMPAPENPGELLKGKTIYIHSTHSVREVTQNGLGGTFIEIWKPILELLGATVIEGDHEEIIKNNVKFDVALVDGTFREEVLEYAKSIDASKVTSEWVIQTIILSGAPDPTAHQKFDPYRLHNRLHH